MKGDHSLNRNAVYVSNRDSNFVILIALALIFFPKRNYIYTNIDGWSKNIVFK